MIKIGFGRVKYNIQYTTIDYKKVCIFTLGNVNYLDRHVDAQKNKFETTLLSIFFSEAVRM